MAVESNGRLVDPGQKGANGHAVGGPRTKAARKKGGFNLFSIITRLLTWYSIITIAFRCPPTVDLITDSSPKICKPYFQAKSVLLPHLTPYYDTYAAPYVDAARPYYNTLDEKVIGPATYLGKKYAAPRFAQAQAYGQAQWQKTLQPEVLKYQAIVKQKYDETLGPHVDKAVATTSPYLDIAKTNALQTYYGHILPTYTVVQPYAQQGYRTGLNFAVNTGIPFAQWAWTTGNVFLDRTVWPKLRILYGENVEPQLVRIGERLGRYRDGKKLKAAIDRVDSSSSLSPASSSFSSATSSVSSAEETAEETAEATADSTSTTSSSTADIVSSSAEPAHTPLSEAELIAKAQVIVQGDLKNWQKKWAKAADEGSDELEARITEITDRLIKSQAQGVGKALITQLEETIKSSLTSLKSDILSIVKKSTDKDGEESEEEISTAVRKAGVAIKDKAQAVRTWRQKYDEETNSLVSKAAMDTFQIIDTIRDMGLQEIGMRWAWTDGITHKDWTKYHALKDRFDEWRLDVEKVATEHPGLEKARAASEEVESQAMGEAEDAAKELASIKEIGRWKLSVGDTSDDFTPQKMPAKIAEAVSEASEAIIGTSASSQGTVESAASAASSSSSGLPDETSSSAMGTSADTVESLASDANAQSAASAASEAVPVESASSLSDDASSSVSSASSVAPDEASSVSSSVSSAASSVSSQASKSVWGGAMAQHVEARKVIYEDVVDDSDETFSEKIQSMASEAGDKFADVTKAVSEALLKPTSTQGSVESMTSLAAEQYSSALAAASSVLYGTQQGPGESIAGVASSRYAEAVAAASAVIYGTPLSPMQSISSAASSAYYGPPTGVLESISSVAASRLSEGLSIASAQFSSAKSSIGPATTPLAQKYLLQAENQFYAGVGMAHARYSEFLEAASSAVTPTQTPWTESVASQANKNWEALVTKASEQIYGAPTPYYITKGYTVPGSLYSQATDEAGILYAQATDRAISQYEAMQSLVSELVSGKEAPYTKSVYSRFSSAYATGAFAAASSASSAISAAFSPPPALESILNSASSRVNDAIEAASVQFYGTQKGSYEQATSSAASIYSSAQSVASEKIYGSTTGYVEAASSSIADAAASAQSAISEAIYGTPTGAYASATSAIAENISIAQAKASSMIYGPEKGAVESAQSRLTAVVESAHAKLAEFAAAAGEGASDAVKKASEGVEEFASSVSSAVDAATSHAKKDEL